MNRLKIHAPGGIRTCIPIKRAFGGPRLRQRGQWDKAAGISMQIKNKRYLFCGVAFGIAKHGLPVRHCSYSCQNWYAVITINDYCRVLA